MITLSVNGREVEVADNITVATAVFATDVAAFRISITGEPRFPVCGMGICFECRVTIDGTPNMRSCQILAENGMIVRTDE